MTFTYTSTRTGVRVDQVDLFLKQAGIADEPRAKVVNGVDQKWLEAVAVYVEADGLRELEGELQISWSLHSDHADLTISTDLPGWEGGVAPELSVLASRLRAYAESKGRPTRFWVLFVPAIRNDAVLYPIRCEAVGVGGKVPDWKQPPRDQRVVLQDMTEANITLRDAR